MSKDEITTIFLAIVGIEILTIFAYNMSELVKNVINPIIELLGFIIWVILIIPPIGLITILLYHIIPKNFVQGA